MNLKQRVFEDYLKPSRLPLYQQILELALLNNYEMMSELSFYKLITAGDIDGRKILVNRHDIDTSPKVASKMFEIEKKVYGKNGSSTYYFRLSTIDRELIKMIDSFGYETGYHYEELATLEKKTKTKSKEGMMGQKSEAEQQFLKNLGYFRRFTGSPSISVASHGDFINTKYKIQNAVLLENEMVRNKGNILFEAYDPIVNTPIEKRFADQVLLAEFAPQVIDAIKDGVSVIMLLTHPRNWQVDFFANTKDNAKRLIEGTIYRL